KIMALYDLALKGGAPVIGFVDCAGLRLEEATDALAAFGGIYLKQAQASGIVPQITAVVGNCGGGSAVLASMSDFVFMEEKNGKLFVSAPNTLDNNNAGKCDTAAAGYMAAKGVAKITKADKTTEHRMISCGAGAGMAAAFNAPLAGTMFVLEEIHHTFDKSLLCMGIVATITADYTSKLFFGQDTVFNYDTVNFPLRYYWLLILLGIILGICGVLYNVIMSKAQDIYKSISKVPNYIKLPCVFILSGIIGLVLPQVLCGGHSMVEFLMNDHPSVGVMLFLLAAKFLFGAVCFASGAPGGTLYPLCILGTYIGAVFGAVSINALNLSPELWEEFVVIGMAGFFASIVRAPITGIVLVFELTGNMNNILPIATVSLISYAVANLLGINPFYETLLEKIINKNPAKPEFHSKNEKILRTYVIPTGSPLSNKPIMDINWGRHCLVVSIERNDVSITPKGDTLLKEGDELAILVSQRHFAKDNERLERIING
ncbi:MAG: chloride channel protein, partial [Eubacterium sp.]|nr:chloride channel protein [Eubacterium sp.]